MVYQDELERTNQFAANMERHHQTTANILSLQRKKEADAILRQKNAEIAKANWQKRLAALGR
jgi:predicted DNA-binding protein (UPF0251 family)